MYDPNLKECNVPEKVTTVGNGFRTFVERFLIFNNTWNVFLKPIPTFLFYFIL